MRKFPFIKQLDAMDCGPACLKMIAEYYGREFSLDELRERSNITRLGVSMYGISEAAESIGFRTKGMKINYESLKEKAPLPCIVHWNQNHFVVVYFFKNRVYVSDPSFGRIQYSKEEFLKGFLSNNETGLALFLTPTPDFYEIENKKTKKYSGLTFLFSYLRGHTKFFIQLFFGLIAGSIILLITPFLTQAMVDFGINKQDIGFVYIIFIAQLMLFAGSSAIEIIRSWILLHIGTRVNISIVSDFLTKMLKLPLKIFNSKMMGDILQRIEDHKRIERLLTITSLNTLFSSVNIIIFGIVLLIYDDFIFFVFFAGSIISTLWTFAFLKRRKALDFKRFNQQSLNRGKLVHIIQGIEEIKVSNSAKQKRWEWENIQAKLFKINIKSLSLGQFQHFGSSAVTQFKNIVVSIIAAKAVIDGNITLGAMMAIMFIIGQLNVPIAQILNFVLTFQDAKIGLERISEIHIKKDEEDLDKRNIRDIPNNRDIILEGVSFSYDGSKLNYVLKNLDLVIPSGKVTAIIGISGSGKTTLMKLLLKFYEPQKGQISLGNINFNDLHSGKWREKCGVVFQDGYLFSDTIAKNISLGRMNVDYKKVEESLKIANIYEFVNKRLPSKYMTKIGEEGLKLSQGQSQRILLARAVYKDPEYLFLDEATSSLDANSEKEIMKNLNDFFVGKTVVIIAHRLSTVKNADKIVVLDKGRLVEEGTHDELVMIKKHYYKLVKNQLELGK